MQLRAVALLGGVQASFAKKVSETSLSESESVSEFENSQEKHP